MNAKLLGMNDPVNGIQYPPYTSKILNILKTNPPLLKIKSDFLDALAEELYQMALQDPPQYPIRLGFWTQREAIEILSQQYGVTIWGLLNEVPVTVVDSMLQP